MSKHWHIVAYDISNRKRLRLVHRLWVKHGLWTQRSVFLCYASTRMLRRLLDETAAIMDVHQDDLRAYPVPHPARLWMSTTFEGQPEPPKPSRLRRGLKALAGQAKARIGAA